MERIFVNTSIRWRMSLGLVAVAVVAAFGLWFLGARFLGTPAEDAEAEEALVLGLMLAAIAILGALRLGHYGWHNVLSLDADEKEGRARISLWRPFGAAIVDTRLDEIVDWRYEVGRKNTRMPIHRFRARIDEPSCSLLFEISPRRELHPLFRELAAEAINQFEEQTGIAYLRGGQDTAN